MPKKKEHKDQPFLPLLGPNDNEAGSSAKDNDKTLPVETESEAPEPDEEFRLISSRYPDFKNLPDDIRERMLKARARLSGSTFARTRRIVKTIQKKTK